MVSSMNALNRLFFKGLIVVLPVTISLYVLILVATKAESVFGGLIKKIIGPELYLPGLGIFLTFIAILGVGVLVSNFITGKIVNWGISKFEKAPFVKAIYSPVKDLISLFAGNTQNNMKKVVFVDFKEMGFKSIGLITREEFSDLPAGSVAEDNIAVYIPMSYMLGGFTAIVPRSSVIELDIPVEKAIKLAITGWITSDNNNDL